MRLATSFCKVLLYKFLGLNLRLYLQEHEYVPGLAEGVGFRLDIHDFGTLPFVEENGLALAPGLENFIAMKRVKLNIPNSTSLFINCDFEQI